MTREERERFSGIEHSITKLQEGLTKFSTAFEVEFGNQDRDGNLTQQLRVLHRLIKDLRDKVESENTTIKTALYDPEIGHVVKLAKMEGRISDLEAEDRKRSKVSLAVGITAITLFGTAIISGIVLVIQWLLKL